MLIFLMTGRRSLLGSVLRSRVGRCGEKIAVYGTAGLQFEGLIRHIQHNAF